MSSAFKTAGLHVLKSFGVMSVATQTLRANTLVILCYHGLSLRDEHEWEGGLYIPATRFRQALQWLRDSNAQVLPLQEGFTRLRAGTLPPRSVVIPFDDGFYDFHRLALPLLREFGYPATVYLTTFYSRHRLPIFNLTTSYLLWKGKGAALTAAARGLELAAMLQRAETQELDTARKDDAARELAESLNVDYNQILRDRLFQIMAPDEIADVSRAGIDIQLHTHRHRTPLDRELFLREIDDNSREIVRLTGNTPRHFCYPSGVTAPDFLPWLQERGIESATTCRHGLARRDSEPLLLPRYLDASGVTRLHFESWLSGLR